MRPNGCIEEETGWLRIFFYEGKKQLLMEAGMNDLTSVEALSEYDPKFPNGGKFSICYG